MKMSDLIPGLEGSLDDGAIWFQCPFPRCQATTQHRIRLAVSSQPAHERDPQKGEVPGKNGKVKVWQASGDWPDGLTLSPSVNIVDDNGATLCWHGTIANGEVT